MTMDFFSLLLILSWGEPARADVVYNAITTPGIVVTGVRADSPFSVVITASYISEGTTSAGLYEGTLQQILTAPASDWTFLTPVFGGETVTSSTFYGPNTAYYAPSLGAGNIRAVGSYKYEESSSGANLDHGMMYEGATDGSGVWTKLDATSLVRRGRLLNTIAHSTMGDLIVGNYDTNLVTGNAFIYNIKTKTWVDLKPVRSRSVTAYGIWQNGGSSSNSYTIAGGFSDVKLGGLDEGYLVDYNSVTGRLTNFKRFNYKNVRTSNLISHFDGITGTKSGYNLTGDYLKSGGAEGGFFASVSRRADGSFSDAKWTEIAFISKSAGRAKVTSGNTVVDNNVLGIYVDKQGGAASYVATVYDIHQIPNIVLQSVDALGWIVGTMLE